MAPVDEHEAGGHVPAGGDGGRVTDDGDREVLRPGRLNGPSPERQSVDPAGLGVDEGVVVVLEACLVLLRATVVVDAEHDRVAGAQAPSPGDPCGEVEGRPAAVRADFDDGGEARPCGALGDYRERKALVVGHEALGRPCRLEQALVSGPGSHRRPFIQRRHSAGRERHD